jgi:hypothetical protein
LKVTSPLSGVNRKTTKLGIVPELIDIIILGYRAKNSSMCVLPNDVFLFILSKYCHQFITQINGEGVHMAIYDSIYKSNISHRKSLYANIILSGGVSLLPGLSNRIQNEIFYLAPSNMGVCLFS